MNMSTSLGSTFTIRRPDPTVVTYSSTASSAMSRLMQMQARIQERQQAQKEQKLKQIQDHESEQQRMVESLVTRSSSSGSNHSNNLGLSFSMDSSKGGGRVRHMFEQRRRNKDGWDKSHPLKPISKDDKELSSSFQQQRATAEFSGQGIRRSKSHNSISNKENKTSRKPTTSKSKNDLSVISNSRGRTPVSPLSTPIKKAVPKRRNSPPPQASSKSKGSSHKANNEKKNHSLSKGKSKSKTTAAPSPVATANGTVKGGKSAPVAKKVKEERPDPGDGRVPCDICGRYFAEDRIAKHKNICQKTESKERKVFDPTKARTQGTEAEQFIKKGTHLKEEPTPKKADWRKKREEFVSAVREARKVQAHLDKGGKLEDLPPPKPSENADYVTCPHCNRRFNQGAADRHIPKCQNIKSNKKR